MSVKGRVNFPRPFFLWVAPPVDLHRSFIAINMVEYRPMRTTVDIPDSLYRELKSKAAREKRSVKQLILRGVEVELRGKVKKRRRRVTFPLVPSKRPGTLVIDNAKIFELIPFP